MENTNETTTNEQPEVATEIDWKAEARKWEQRSKDNAKAAKENADAAARLAEIEEAQKSNEQKLIERAEAAEARVKELEAAALRNEVANEKGVPVHLLIGETKEALEAHADALLAFKGPQEEAKPTPVAPYVPAEGHTPALALNGDGIEEALRSAINAH